MTEHPRDMARRRIDRTPVSISAALRKNGSPPFTATVCDLSRTGCRAESLALVYISDHVWVTIPGFRPIEAIIRWSTGRALGCEWALTMHDAVYDYLRMRFPESWTEPLAGTSDEGAAGRNAISWHPPT